jgi:hypothetical protein
MNNYPRAFLNQLSRADQLLFDIGYSAALLRRAKAVLQQGDQADPQAVLELIASIEEFAAQRLNILSEIYANAEAAVAKGLPNQPPTQPKPNKQERQPNKKHEN